MLFNSTAFVTFFLVVYLGYLLLRRRLAAQNLLLLVASYWFYGSWDLRFLFLISLSTAIDFVCGLMIDRGHLSRGERWKSGLFVVLTGLGCLVVDWPALLAGRSGEMLSADPLMWRCLAGVTAVTGVFLLLHRRLSALPEERRRRLFVSLSVISNLGLLAVFKYFNFFADSLVTLLGGLGLQLHPVTLQVVLPVGISFYTFQTMSYTLDIHRRQLAATPSLLDFALFVSFFPQLVAGPIERARNLLGQVTAPRRITAKAVHAGLFLILWGYFKKVVIADNMALIADQVFNGYEHYQGLDLVLGAIAFAFQIYGDFSGYSDIARGLAKLMGFELMVNFRLPYFALDPSDFWSRWHVSLSSWLRDYLYIPLGGNRRGPGRTYLNLTLTMLLGGLWHGASWNFVLWGAFHGLILVVYRLLGVESYHRDGRPTARGWHLAAKMATMFGLTLIGWILFRCHSLAQVIAVFGGLGFGSSPESAGFARDLLFFVTPLLLVQIAQQRSRDLLVLAHLRPGPRILAYTAILVLICIFGVRAASEFIYFQF